MRNYAKLCLRFFKKHIIFLGVESRRKAYKGVEWRKLKFIKIA